jgi:hypothetical protein
MMPTSPSPDPFPVFEGHLMAQLGIGDRDDMVSFRRELLVEGVDWAKVGLRIMLSIEGAEKIAAALKVAPYHLAVIRHAHLRAEACTSKKPANDLPGHSPEQPMAVKSESAKNGLVELVVVARPVNPHILICRPQSCQDRSGFVNVRVKKNANFLPPPAATGVILARLVEGSPSLYEFAGHPGHESDVPHCPRWPGRW